MSIQSNAQRLAQHRSQLLSISGGDTTTQGRDFLIKRQPPARSLTRVLHAERIHDSFHMRGLQCDLLHFLAHEVGIDHTV